VKKAQGEWKPSKKRTQKGSKENPHNIFWGMDVNKELQNNNKKRVDV